MYIKFGDINNKQDSKNILLIFKLKIQQSKQKILESICMDQQLNLCQFCQYPYLHIQFNIKLNYIILLQLHSFIKLIYFIIILFQLFLMFPNLKLDTSQEIKDPQTLYDQPYVNKYPSTQLQGNGTYSNLNSFDKFKNRSKQIKSSGKLTFNEQVQILNEKKNSQWEKKSEKRIWLKKKQEALAERLESENIKNNKKLNSLFKQIYKSWQNQNISDFYCFYFINQTKNVPQDDLELALTTELRMIKNKQSFYHKIIKNIQARQTCIIEMKKYLQMLNQLYQKLINKDIDEQQFNKKINSFAEKIRQYRKLTVYIVDKIEQWREYLMDMSKIQNESSENLIFFYNNQNYLLKIIKDTTFFSFSFLSEYLEFSSENDPFLLKPIKNSTQNSKKYQQIFEIDNNLKDKVSKSLDYLAREKAYFNSQKIIKDQLQSYKNRQSYDPKKYANSLAKSKHKYSNTQIKGPKESFQRERSKRGENKIARQEQLSGQKQYDFNDKESIKKIIQNYKNIKGSPKKLDLLKAGLTSKTLNKINQTADKYEKFINKKVPLKQNTDLISELRSEILQKLKKQKNNKNQNLTEQEQLTVQKLKLKMKKQFQIKIKEEKKKKYIEKQILQRKLKEEQLKLINNRQLQITLQIKLNREKDATNIQNIKKKYREILKQVKNQSDKQDQQKLKMKIKMLSMKQSQQLQKYQNQKLKRENILKQKMIFEQRKRKELEMQSDQKEQIDQDNQTKFKTPVTNKFQNQIYRQKIKSNLEKQMRIQLIQRSKRQLQNNQSKKNEIKFHLQKSQKNLKNQINKPFDRNTIQNQVKRDILQKAILERKLDSEMAKKQLREQFEKQLLGSTNSNFSANNQDFIIKNIYAYKQENYLKQKLDPNNKRNFDINNQNIKSQNLNQQFFQNQRLRQNKPLNPSLYQKSNKAFRLGMTSEEYQIYLKKKKNLILNTGQDKEAFLRNLQDQNEYVKVRVYNKPQSMKKREKYQNQEQDFNIRKIKAKTTKPKKRSKIRQASRQSSSSEDLEEQLSIKKRKTNKQDNKNLYNQSYKNQIKKNNMDEPQQFEEFRQEDSPIKMIKQFQYTYPQQSIKSKFQITIEAINQFELEEYISTHFLQLPKQQLDIFQFTKEEIYQKLLEQLTFSLIVGKYENKVIGLCIAYHNRNYLNSRKFVLSHIGTYKTSDHFDFILDVSNFIFKKDPCDEVQFVLRIDQKNSQQLDLCTNFNNKFDKHGSIFQKLLQNSVFQRKYIIKRPFNLKCQAKLGSINKHSFVNLFSVSASVIFSNQQLLQSKQELTISKNHFPERQISYSVMISQIFRNSLNVQQAQNLKVKVKQNLKLKQLLVLVVMLEKKKIKLEQIKLSEAKSISEINQKLLSQGKQAIKIVKDAAGTFNRISHCQLNQSYKLPFNFQTTTLPLEFKEHIRHINYFRLSPLNPHKTYIIKSSLYNAEMHVLPTQNSKVKIFVMLANQFNELKVANQLDLFMYIRVFLKNVKNHNVSNWKYIWIPQIIAKQSWSIRQFRPFLDKDIYIYDSINISYKQFLPGALIIQPQHKDLVITPPFIVGILSITLEQVSEGSPLYARYIDAQSLKAVQTQSKEN